MLITDNQRFLTDVFDMRAFLEKIPLMPLALIAVLLGLAPFAPEPHLWEKLKMLATGTLEKPIDIFDLLMHATPVVLLLLKLIFIASTRKED